MSITREFYQLSRAWYGPACQTADVQDELNIVVHGDGLDGEFTIRWVQVGHVWTPILTAYDDAWAALYRCVDVLSELAKFDGQNPPPNQIRHLLLACGLTDATPEVDPRGRTKATQPQYRRPTKAPVEETP